MLRLDGRGTVVEANAWLEELVGGPEPLCDGSWLGEHERSRLDAAVADVLAGSAGLDLDLHVRSRGGGDHNLRSRVRPLPRDGAAAGPTGVVVSFEDVTESRELHARLRHQAQCDALTGLPNRRALKEWLDDLPPRTPLAVFFVDLDGFKRINDALGHDAGDRLLSDVADALRDSVRPADLVARVGGDEFVVVCPGVGTAARAGRIADRVLDALAVPFDLGEATTTVGASIGVVVGGSHTVSAEEMIGNADLAMYEAKRAGGRRRRFYEGRLRDGAARRFQLESDLRTAVVDGQFELHLQPIVAVADGALHGLEALVRWNHPELGTLHPGQFIPVAERHGAIDALGRWILDDACRVATRLADRHPDATVSVNLSPRQLATDSFPDTVLATLAAHGLAPSRLVLEVTETVFVEMRTTVLAALHRLTAEGVGLALDDFGTGFSSLNHLRSMPATILKIHRSYTAVAGVDRGTTAIMEAIVGLAATLGHDLVAEGVETAEQLRSLAALGIRYAQGFHIARPCSETDLFDSDLLRTGAPLPA